MLCVVCIILRVLVISHIELLLLLLLLFFCLCVSGFNCCKCFLISMLFGIALFLLISVLLREYDIFVICRGVSSTRKAMRRILSLYKPFGCSCFISYFYRTWYHDYARYLKHYEKGNIFWKTRYEVWPVVILLGRGFFNIILSDLTSISLQILLSVVLVS